uniref:Nicotinic acetylcholine receptor subunit n=1 Tax=Ciona intestinalis TaxID=7719 RepID=E7FIZ6_CIOIN|nr:nicotinic acetylcholine receptor alpha6 precursor [Ciona intestinalis]BAJ65321.1 nicotinic acetylcholine receptor subunit [Ciona intestinalis]|eukprot:NP_001232929.1 nicotinic acetylcholine receptor alpha6 precursor [Ciona intestinalis]
MDRRRYVMMTSLLLIVLYNLDAVNSDQVEKQLIEDIMMNYSKLERPIPNHLDTLVVNIKFTLQQIVDVDERNQIITTNAWLDLKWKDYRWRWNKTEYGNITKIRIPYIHMWTPDILLYNSADKNFDPTTHSPIVIDHDGNCLYVPPGIFKSTCKIDVSNFPFDEQQCTLKFGVWSYNGNQVDLQLQPGGGIDATEYIESGEWHLMDLKAKRNTHKYKCCPEYYVDVTFTVTLRRRTMFFIINLVVPCILNSILTLLTFVLPAGAAEKVTLAITVLLAQIVFMLLIMETMPPTSDAIPLISKYFACSLVTVCASVAGTVLVLSFYYASPLIDGRMSPSMRSFFLVHAPKLLRMNPYIPKVLTAAETKPSTNQAKRKSVKPNVVARCLDRKIIQPKQDTRIYPKVKAREKYHDVFFDALNAVDGKSPYKVRPMTNGSTGNTKSHLISNHGQNHHLITTRVRLESNENNEDSQKNNSHHRIKDTYFDIEDVSVILKEPNERQKDIERQQSTSTDNHVTKIPCSCKDRSKALRKFISDENSTLDEILSDLRRINKRKEEDELFGEISLEWQYASRVLDKILLWVFILFVVVATLSTLFAVPNLEHVFM